MGMKKILAYLKSYWHFLDKPAFLICTAFISIAIFINYYWGLYRSLNTWDTTWQYVGWYTVFLAAFAFGYLVILFFRPRQLPSDFWVLMLLAPVLFSWKMAADVELFQTGNFLKDAYWNRVIYWPAKLLIITLALALIWKLFREQQPFYGLNRKDFRAGPYLIMLLVMVPLIAAASTQPDFLNTYPKLKNIGFLDDANGAYKLLYELSYGSDFFTIELFFRGFLVLAFARWVGRDAILPMALFYCTIHFGKPLGECISSYWGGLLLGVVTYHTRSILGGLMVHVGIAWLMELGGYLGNLYLR